MYEERKYRLNKNTDRFEYFTAMYLETDLLIGVNKKDSTALNTAKTVELYANSLIAQLRKEMDAFIEGHPDFATSLKPIRYKLAENKGEAENAIDTNPGSEKECHKESRRKTANERETESEIFPEAISQLLLAGQYASVGPMAGIAGLFSSYVGKKLKEKFDLDEIIVENGGDIFAIIKDELKVKIHAGPSVLSEKVSLKIEAGEWGICTSSGTVGHSLSFGKADAVVIVSEDTVKADTLATSLANKVQGVSDIQEILNYSEKYKVINTILIICEEKLGVRGRMELSPV